jgi:hypothetical protein
MKALLLTSLLLLVPSAASAASVATPANPKVVFVGDQVTANWPLTQTNTNWINQGKANASCETLAGNIQAAIALHPNVIHIMAGMIDQFNEAGMGATYATGDFAGCLQGMAQAAKAANIQVVFGLEPQSGATGYSGEYVSPSTMNTIIAAYAAQQGITVINYENVPVTGPYAGDLTPNSLGYQTMTALLENVLPTLNLPLAGGYLQNVAVNPYSDVGSTTPVANQNTVLPGDGVSFTAVGWFNNNPSIQKQLNTNIYGMNGTWTSSNPLVMTIDPFGNAQALTVGTATIRYTSLIGVPFSEWVMNVVNYGTQ